MPFLGRWTHHVTRPPQGCIHVVVVAQPMGKCPPVVSKWFPPQTFSLHKFATINS